MKIILTAIGFLFLVTACFTEDYQGIKVVAPNEVIIYGPSHFENTVYVGTDSTYHYIRWRRGSKYGDWKIEKTLLKINNERKHNEIHFMIFPSDWQRWINSEQNK